MQEDLTLPNHLSGLRKKYLQLLFDSTRDLMTVRKTLLSRTHAETWPLGGGERRSLVSLLWRAHGRGLRLHLHRSRRLPVRRPRPRRQSPTPQAAGPQHPPWPYS